MRGRRRRAQRPGHYVNIIGIEQGLEPGKFLLAPCAMVAIEEAADEEIGLARAAVPGAEAGAREPLGKGGRGAHGCVPSHSFARLQLAMHARRC